MIGHCSQCDYWAQDCPDGEACKPWANDGSEVWNAHRCTAVDDAPDLPGEPCEAVDSGWSGIDSCDLGAFCWNVDPDTNTGTCVPQCEGTELEPICPEGTRCLISDGEALTLCLPACDPLAPDCDEGQGCYPGSNDDFVCLREGEGVFANGQHTSCAPGSFLSAKGCVSFCDLTAKTPCEEGSVCTPFFEDEAPAAYANVGGCLPAT